MINATKEDCEAANKMMDTIQDTDESKIQSTFLMDPAEGDKFYDGAGGEQEDQEEYCKDRLFELYIRTSRGKAFRTLQKLLYKGSKTGECLKQI